MARHIITRQAEEDIADILAYIAADDLDAAIRLSDRFYEVFELLGANKEAGRLRPELKDDLRSFPLGAYLIFYRKWAEKIAIVRVIHSARDLDAIFG